jgi:acyl-CoA synthetase (AMP-forming)/AMP-acid ligase II
LNLLAPFLDNVERWSARTAIVAPQGDSATFGALAERSERLAARWRGQGIAPGDRVLLAMPLGVALYAAIAALWRIGAVAVFPEPALGLKGLRHAAKATAPKAFLSDGWYRALNLLPELWRIPLRLRVDEGAVGTDFVYEAARDHPALISFTSGSTGAPKAIVRSHGFLAAQNSCVGDLLRAADERQTDLVAFPVFVIANLGLGVSSVLPDWKLTRHDLASGEAIARLVDERGVTRALLPPSICEILAEGPRMRELRTVLTGGGPVFPDVMQRLAERLATKDIVVVYGSTEAEPIAHQRFDEISAADWTLMREGGGLLAGKPIPQIRMTLIDDEIVVTGDHVNKAYLDRAADAETKLDRDGEIWHRTGDAGRIDDQGRLWLLGRKSARAGRFFPFEVETAARLWPGVRQVALIPGANPPVLAIAGDAAKRTLWAARAEALGGLNVMTLDAIPLDRRHRSKVDYAELKRLALSHGRSGA